MVGIPVEVRLPYFKKPCSSALFLKPSDTAEPSERLTNSPPPPNALTLGPPQYNSLKYKQETCLTSLKTLYISVQTIYNTTILLAVLGS
jgi:hypothetical protein